MKKKKLLLKSLFSLVLLTSCSVQIPNVKGCAVAGVMEAGMDCFHTLSDEEESISPEEIKNFLEAMPEIRDLNGNVIQEAHGAAICQPSADWEKEHAALESACEKLGASCSYDIRKAIENVNSKVRALQDRKLQ